MNTIDAPDGTRWIVLDDKTHAEMVELISRPESGTPKLAELFARSDEEAA